MMYGVSMSKDGTSKVVAQKIDDAGARAEVAEADEVVAVPEPDAVR